MNIGSVYRTARAVLPQRLRQGSGAIINISSLAAIRWTEYPYFLYYATKAAVNQATVALAMQYARDGIRANRIMPGLIDTPLIYKQISGQYASVEEMVEARNRAVPMGRMGTAWDIANVAVFLASDEAEFITGVCSARGWRAELCRATGWLSKPAFATPSRLPSSFGGHQMIIRCQLKTH